MKFRVSFQRYRRPRSPLKRQADRHWWTFRQIQRSGRRPHYSSRELQGRNHRTDQAIPPTNQRRRTWASPVTRDRPEWRNPKCGEVL